MADAFYQMTIVWVTIVHFSLVLLSYLHSPAPTLEEVNAWAQSFDKLMLTPAGRNAFREFLRTEFSEENMLFWMACEELKQESNKSVIEEKARLIYEDYISILSPKEVYCFPHSLMLFCMVDVFIARRIPGDNSFPHIPLLRSRDLGVKYKPSTEVRWSELLSPSVRKFFLCCFGTLMWRLQFEAQLTQNAELGRTIKIMEFNTEMKILFLLNLKFICWTNQWGFLLQCT